MIRRDFFAFTLGALVSKNEAPAPSMGKDRCEWLKFKAGKWSPAEVEDIESGDVVMKMDIKDGAVTGILIFCADKDNDGKEVATKWYVDVDDLAVNGPKKK